MLVTQSYQWLRETPIKNPMKEEEQQQLMWLLKKYIQYSRRKEKKKNGNNDIRRNEKRINKDTEKILYTEQQNS